MQVDYKDLGMKAKPLVPNHRALINVGFKTRMDIWQFDVTTQFFGNAPLPYTGDNAADYQLPTKSQQYITQHFQITKQFRWFECYVGVENALDYRQENAILSADDPFGLYFDASMIYAPVNGRVIYGGLRYKFRK